MSWFNWFGSPKVDDTSATEDCDLELLNMPDLAEEALENLKEKVKELRAERDSSRALIAQLNEELSLEKEHSRALSKELEDISRFWSTKSNAIESVLKAKDISIATLHTEDIVDEIDNNLLPPFPEMTDLQDITPELVQDLVDSEDDLPDTKPVPGSPWDDKE